ncbi:hypothetical protein [Hansschlegelia zhihuaiae]|uniref:Uncharacterized protein n=1 Tax=Hansschlegelia zhihuaiae TaxID=405005 RepID=A0A4Q0MNG8_9HYPH|nr:hypothetical protein [Hansschlegelia zhihuaiae]RXF75055.1 hypothetical protein EK403_03130 [Hansschlegelia zhihuaiae]
MASVHTLRERLPRRSRHSDAYFRDELAPCGEAGGLVAEKWAPFSGEPADVSDCLVVRPRPWILTIWEPLETNAPSPTLARPYCCLLNTVIFYDAQYRKMLWSTFYCASTDRLRRGGVLDFYRFDTVKTRLLCEQPVVFERETFIVGCGRVLWASHGRDRRRWWMRHPARRAERRP